MSVSFSKIYHLNLFTKKRRSTELYTKSAQVPYLSVFAVKVSMNILRLFLLQLKFCNFNEFNDIPK